MLHIRMLKTKKLQLLNIGDDKSFVMNQTEHYEKIVCGQIFDADLGEIAHNLITKLKLYLSQRTSPFYCAYSVKMINNSSSNTSTEVVC